MRRRTFLKGAAAAPVAAPLVADAVKAVEPTAINFDVVTTAMVSPVMASASTHIQVLDLNSSDAVVSAAVEDD